MLELRFLSGPDIDDLGIGPDDAITAVEGVVEAHGLGRTVFEPRTHLVPNNGGIGHFNVLRGHVDTLGEHGVSGVKVVGDFVPNYQVGLPSELALMTLYDPFTGVPLAILDATLITEMRTGAMTAVGAKHLARPDSRILGHVGARGTAYSNVTMLDRLFPLEEIRVTSRRPESRPGCARSPTPRCGRWTPPPRPSTTRTSWSRRPAWKNQNHCCVRQPSSRARSSSPTARSARSSWTCST
jgi:ornithine cyclodeaminase